MSLYISVFLLFLPFRSQCVISSKTGFLFVVWSTHICREMGLFTGANDVPVVKVFALHSSTSLVCYTKKLFRTNSWLTLCFIPSQKGIESFHRYRFQQGSLPSQRVQSIPLFIRHRSECFFNLTPCRHLNNH